MGQNQTGKEKRKGENSGILAGRRVGHSRQGNLKRSFSELVSSTARV
jgi:hypothetical protein